MNEISSPTGKISKKGHRHPDPRVGVSLFQRLHLSAQRAQILGPHPPGLSGSKE